MGIYSLPQRLLFFVFLASNAKDKMAIHLVKSPLFATVCNTQGRKSESLMLKFSWFAF